MDLQLRSHNNYYGAQDDEGYGPAPQNCSASRHLGQDSPNGGTSAAAPTWAALLARMATGQWQPSFLSPLLYQAAPGGGTIGSVGCVDITSGNNKSPQPGDGYDAEPGFDAVSGWGVPNGEALVQALAAASPAQPLAQTP